MAKTTSEVTELHAAVKRGDLPAMRRLLESDPALANARSETDARGTFPLHVAAESGQAGAARLLLEYGPTYRPATWRTTPSRSAGRRSRGGRKWWKSSFSPALK
jgi:ankyrin repeat protein